MRQAGFVRGDLQPALDTTLSEVTGADRAPGFSERRMAWRLWGGDRLEFSMNRCRSYALMGARAAMLVAVVQPTVLGSLAEQEL